MQNWVGSPRDKMMDVMEAAEAKQGRLMELDVTNAGMCQKTVDDFQEMDRRLYQVLCMHQLRGEEPRHCNPERSDFKAWKQMVCHSDPRSGVDRSVAYSRVTHPVCQSGLTSGRPKILQGARKHFADVGTRGGRV